MLPNYRIALWVALGAVLVACDFFTGPFIQFPFLFIIPIGLAAWFSGRITGLALAMTLPLVRPLFYYDLWDAGIDNATIVTNLIIKIMVLGILAELIHRIASARRFQSQILESLPVGMWVADGNGRIIQANAAGNAIWGGAIPSEPGERMRRMRWHASGRPMEARESALDKALRNGESSLNEVLDIERGDGDHRTILNSVMPVRDEQGRIAGALLINQDITQDKRMEREREDLIRSLEDAMRNIKILKGLLPVCAACKKIRDDGGYWQQMEEYIRDHSEADFSHGICPECLISLYPEYSRG
jgi:PAS domain S-box-containing protein